LTPSRTSDIKTVQHNGGYQEEDAGHEGGEG